MRNKKKDIQDNIKRFCSHFENQILLISGLGLESVKIFQKSLLCSAIDALSICVHPRKDPRERFTSFVKRFGEWSYQDRVSLTHLNRLLEMAPDPAFEELRLFAHEELLKWEASWSTISIEKDPTFAQVNEHWPNSREYKDSYQKVKYRAYHSFKSSLYIQEPART